MFKYKSITELVHVRLKQLDDIGVQCFDIYNQHLNTTVSILPLRVYLDKSTAEKGI